MRLCYVLLSPTFGMHQYTADLANRMAAAGHEVTLVTTSRLPRDRYGPGVAVETPVAQRDTGLSGQGLRLGQYRAARRAIQALQPQVVHITGVHLWNPWLVGWLRQEGVPVIHTLHDVEPHAESGHGRLLYPWNRLVLARADRVLVHGRWYERQLQAQGVAAEKLVRTPVLHRFLGYEAEARLNGAGPALSYEPMVLFFGRLANYKGVEILLTAFAAAAAELAADCRLVLAGPGKLAKVWAGSLPPRVERRNWLIGDEEALDLFSRCSLVVLPYVGATQSALVGAAYSFCKPVLVTRSGALPEYVAEGVTGFIVEPGHPASLARGLVEAMADRERLIEMGRQGREWYEQQRAAEWQTLQAMYREAERMKDEG